MEGCFTDGPDSHGEPYRQTPEQESFRKVIRVLRTLNRRLAAQGFRPSRRTVREDSCYVFPSAPERYEEGAGVGFGVGVGAGAEAGAVVGW